MFVNFKFRNLCLLLRHSNLTHISILASYVFERILTKYSDDLPYYKRFFDCNLSNLSCLVRNAYVNFQQQKAHLHTFHLFKIFASSTSWHDINLKYDNDYLYSRRHDQIYGYRCNPLLLSPSNFMNVFTVLNH